MFIVMSANATDSEINAVKAHILDEGFQPHDSQGTERTVIAVVGEVGGRRYKLTSREFHAQDTVIHVGDVAVGDGSLTIMAGPCSVESREQLFETATAVAAAGATLLRRRGFQTPT